jgi:hypothetical protein
MRLTPPKKIVFYISVLAIAVGVLEQLFGFFDNADLAFWLAAGGGILLALGNSMKGV